jgi:hypothetical protein
MKAALDRAELIDKLRVQRRRLAEALDRFYSRDLPGDSVALQAAVLDIAVPIRVLVHHFPEKKSACLLHQVDPEYWKKPIRFAPVIATPQRTLPSGVMEVSVSIPINMTMAGGKTSFTRYQKGQKPQAKVPLKNWWIDPCWDSGTNKVSNKDIVLAISNKEGGAHVDGDTTQKYRIAKSQGRLSIGGNPINDIARLGSLIGIAGDELLEYLDDHYPESA